MKFFVNLYLILCLTFFVLKFCNIVDWSWFWALFPIILPWIILAGMAIGLGVFLGLLIVFTVLTK